MVCDSDTNLSLLNSWMYF